MQWQASLPHGGSIDGLARFWTQWHDPLLVDLVSAAQMENASLAQAASRVAQARAASTAAGATLTPTLDAQVSALRNRTQPAAPIASSVQLGVQAAWELDLFGANRSTQSAAHARLQSAEAAWHDARVLVAAEVAVAYLNHRFCVAQTALTDTDARSRESSARLASLSAQAGFTAPAIAELAQASSAEGRQRLTEQRAACDLQIKQLVALTGLPEPQLRQKMAANSAPVPDFAGLQSLFGIASVPAQVLTQRPDVLSAEREVLAAAAELQSSQTQSLPRISLAGSIGAARMSSAGLSSDGLVWSLGPVALTLPLYDGGRRAANVEAARARYEESTALYRTKLRGAVREVEEALINLQSTQSRATDVQRAAVGYRAHFVAAEQRYRAGLASLIELEDARRTALAADTGALALLRERIAAWISLYRAAGGGFTPS